VLLNRVENVIKLNYDPDFENTDVFDIDFFVSDVSAEMLVLSHDSEDEEMIDEVNPDKLPSYRLIVC
jgi:hypothetical protein